MDEKVKVYAEITGFTPSIFQQDLIEMRVQDVGRWRKAVIWWASNDYRPQSVGKVLDYYDEMGQETVKHKKLSPDVGRWDGVDRQAPPEPCQYCGKGICWADHRDQWEAQPVQ